MYSPKVSEEFIPELFKLKQQSGKPMTKLVDEAVRKYLEEQNEFLNGKTKEDDSNGKDTKRNRIWYWIWK
mgnify:CR=1 FL=1